MSYQPNLFSPEQPEKRAAAPGALLRSQSRGPKQNSPGPSAWLRRTELLVRVIVRLYLGLLILALPWMRFWTENGILSFTRGTALVANSGFVRGAVSGLGLLNVIMAFRELFFPDQSP